MFEHFGLKDVLIALWKYIRYLIILLVLAAVVVLALRFTRSDAEAGPQDTRPDIFSSSVYYSVSATEDDSRYTIGESGNTLGTSRYLASIYMNMINTDYCRDYIFNQVMEQYSKEEFLEKSGLLKKKPELTADHVSLKSLTTIFHTSLITDSSVINMFAETYDKDLSMVIVQAASDYLEKVLATQLEPAKITKMSQVNQVLKITEEEQKLLDSKGAAAASQNQTVSTTPSLKKQAVILGILTVALYCIVVFFIALFRPTMNRKCDFEAYGFPVIGELGKYKK